MADRDRAQDRAEQRKHDRAENVERIMDSVEEDLDGRKYPVRSEELAKEYADQPLDVPNETESLGSVFDRMTNSGRDEFESAEEVRESLYGELTGRTAGKSEANEGRDLEAVEERVDETDSL